MVGPLPTPHDPHAGHAALRMSGSAAAQALLAHLRSDAAQTVFQDSGFMPGP